MKTKSTIKALTLVGALGAAAIAVAACGGGAGGDDFVAGANAACLQASQRSSAITVSPAGALASQQDAITAEKGWVREQTAKVAALRALDAPADQRAAFADFVAKSAAAAEAEQAALKLAQAGDPEAYRSQAGKAGGLSEAATDAAARVDGLDVCARELPASQAEEITERISATETEADPGQCTDYFMPNVVKQQWNSVQKCREFQESERQSQISDSVDVKVTGGVDHVNADAVVSFHGGSNDGLVVDYGLYYKDGEWMVAFANPKES